MTVAKALTSYEIERNKPMPNRIHGQIQGDLLFLLNLKYREKFDFSAEVSLATTPPSTPDVGIFPVEELDIQKVKAKETDPPITTIEIQSPSQSPDELVKKVYELYFPMGVQSAWVVLPAVKAIQVLLPNGKKVLFSEGQLKDPITGIELDIKEVFKKLK
ncbi:MAG: Uma2 family endonuclease [Bacteroidota bacterium]